MFQRYTATVKAQQEGGAGLLADEQVRYFQREYHNRFINKGTQYLPTNYQVGEAFFESRENAPGFYLLPERDYQFSFADFLDYITGADAPVAQLEQGFGFLDGHIYNLTSSDSLGALLLETQGAGAYAVRAANIVRRGDELVVMLSLGEQLAADRLADLVEHRDFSQGVNPAKPSLATLLQNARHALGYIDGTELLATTAMVRFNLRERRVETRVLLRDMTDTFRTWTDARQALSVAVAEDSEAFRNMVAELDACDAVWEVAKTLTLFPAYLAARIKWSKERRERTELGVELPKSLKKQRELKAVAVADRVLFRTISAIEYVRAGEGGGPRLEGRSYSAPNFQVAVEGFWRRLGSPQAKGKGPADEEVLGKTWVRSHIRHKDKAVPVVQRVVYIKASLSEAKARLEKFRQRAEREPVVGQLPFLDLELPAPPIEPPVEEVRPSRPGAFVYIMRCHAHTENLFKVGFTDRDPEVRAKELSAVTSAPLPFLVVHAWAVSDGHAAERSAHEALAAVRLAENREFFHLPYAELRALVDGAVRTWALP
ncbi:GIY-YIG nuclease family protein [Roseateles sp. MS654]|uniref:GIY-YIG nuclease family protein n=1 Tax=Roseateles sp. MS654 TaxID=3412685 RepID=UPI003C2FF013